MESVALAARKYRCAETARVAHAAVAAVRGRREENLRFVRRKREPCFSYCSTETATPPVHSNLMSGYES